MTKNSVHHLFLWAHTITSQCCIRSRGLFYLCILVWKKMPSPIRLIKNCLFKAVIWLGGGKKSKLSVLFCRQSQWMTNLYLFRLHVFCFVVFFFAQCESTDVFGGWHDSSCFWMALWLCFWNNNPLCFVLDGLILISLFFKNMMAAITLSPPGVSFSCMHLMDRACFQAWSCTIWSQLSEQDMNKGCSSN